MFRYKRSGQGHAWWLLIVPPFWRAQPWPAQPKANDKAQHGTPRLQFVLMGAQGGLYAWRKYHRRSYELASLVGLWVIPPIISFELGFYRFLLAWAVYSAISGFHLYLCYVGPLSKDLPLRVRAWRVLDEEGEWVGGRGGL